MEATLGRRMWSLWSSATKPWFGVPGGRAGLGIIHGVSMVHDPFFLLPDHHIFVHVCGNMLFTA